MTQDIRWHHGVVSREVRQRLSGGPGVTVWLTGLSASGKSTIAFEAERRLISSGRAAYVLDGDNLRHGLNADLGFTADDRAENVRRVGEVARLMADSGLVVLVPIISPYRAGRRNVRRSHSDADIDFVEVHVSTPIEECERRDPKGLYARARAGEIKGFTGIDDPYEPPVHPDLDLDTSTRGIESCVEALLDHLREVG